MIYGSSTNRHTSKSLSYFIKEGLRWNVLIVFRLNSSRRRVGGSKGCTHSGGAQPN